MARGIGRPGKMSHTMKAQSAVEYMLTYGWAILIASIIAAMLFFYVFTPSNVYPQMCYFSTGSYCVDIVLGSNSISTTIGLFLTNTQPYPILNPEIAINSSSIPPTSGTCKPSFVLEGGAMICSAIIPDFSLGATALVSGQLYLSSIPCPSGNSTTCQASGTQPQTLEGTFTAHVTANTTAPLIYISISAGNYSMPANGDLDPLTANVLLLGMPISGATVLFTQSDLPQSSISIVPPATTTGGDGSALSGIGSTAVGPTRVFATFGDISDGVWINFTQPGT